MKAFGKALIVVAVLFVAVPLLIACGPVLLSALGIMFNAALAMWPLLIPVAVVFVALWVFFARG